MEKHLANREVFIENDNYLFFLSQYDKYLKAYFETLAFCLIPNHFHFLIRVKENCENVAIRLNAKP